MAKIQRMIQDADTEPSAVTSLITVEIATLAIELMALRHDPTVGWQRTTRVNAIEALRELQRSVMDTQFLANKDMLNVDGPKFTYVFNQIVDWSVRAMKDAGLPEVTRNNILMQWRDSANVQAEDLRREVRKMDSGPRRGFCYSHDPNRVAKEPPPRPPEGGGMARIQRLIEDADADTDPSAVMRLITLEIATLATELVALRHDPTVGWQGRTRVNAIKAFRELQHSFMDTRFLSNKDVLNFDGPKFIFALERIVAWFTRALKDAGLPEETRDNVLKRYRDILNLEEPDLRREVHKIGEVEEKVTCLTAGIP